MLDECVFENRRILVTGHTGFKGVWLSHWLAQLGARVVGFGLPPATTPTAYGELPGCISVTGDIRDERAVFELFEKHAPEIVFHLAAQPLVRRSYREPLATYATNVLGTAHVLEAARRLNQKCAVVVVTTDKCYENNEEQIAYKECDRVGGHDPYSASKACAELVTSSYRRSYFEQGPVFVASVRAGNVIGGGDWSEDRLIPDVVRALAANDAIHIRNPSATRPWQHVLEPLRGYLALAERLWTADGEYAEAWNFGPSESLHVPVKLLVERLVWNWGEGRIVIEGGLHPHEAKFLALDSGKAQSRLGWKPILSFDDTIRLTVDWYKQFYADAARASELTAQQLDWYRRRVAECKYSVISAEAAA